MSYAKDGVLLRSHLEQDDKATYQIICRQQAKIQTEGTKIYYELCSALEEILCSAERGSITSEHKVRRIRSQQFIDGTEYVARLRLSSQASFTYTCTGLSKVEQAQTRTCMGKHAWAPLGASASKISVLQNTWKEKRSDFDHGSVQLEDCNQYRQETAIWDD